MKASVQKLMATAVLGLALSSNCLPAWAGDIGLAEVLIGPDSARGSMVGARYSADSRQYIGCSFSNTNGPFVTCWAVDRTGKSLLCTSNNEQGAAAVKAMTDSSDIAFGVVPGSAACKFLHVENDSANIR